MRSFSNLLVIGVSLIMKTSTENLRSQMLFKVVFLATTLMVLLLLHTVQEREKNMEG